MKNLNFKPSLFLLVCGIIFAGMLTSYDKGYTKGYAQSCSDELASLESKALEGCEFVARQMMKESDVWRHRAETCRELMQELIR